MRRLAIIIAACLIAGFAVTAWALPPREYGLEDYRPKPDCPRTTERECSATVDVTGYQIMQLRQRDGDVVTEYPTRVRKRNGWLVAFSLTLGRPTEKERDFFNQHWGRPASA